MVNAIGSHVGATFVYDGKIENHLNEAFVTPSKFEDQALTLSEALFETRVENSTPIDVDPLTILVLDIINSDPRNRWDGTSTYTAEFSGVYSFELPFSVVTGSGNISYDCYLYEDGLQVQQDAVSTSTVGTFYLSHSCTQGKEYTFYVESSKNSTINIQMNTVNVPISIYDLPYNPTRNMPVMKAADFISGFLKAFNLILFKTDVNEYTITDTISLYNNYATTVDLTDYVNETSLTYKKLNVFDLVRLKHKENDVSPNIFYFDVNGKDFAELSYTPSIDFSDGTLDNTSIFSVFPPAYISSYDNNGAIGRTDLWCHFQLSNDDEPKPVLSNFLLMYRNGVEATTNNWWLQDGNNVDGSPTFTQQLTWGRYSQVQDANSTSSSKTLSYSQENPFIGAVAQGTIVNEFYLDWLAQLYKRTAYTLEITFPISFGVFLKISAISVVYLNGFYHLLASYKYDSAKNAITLRLLRFDALVDTVATEENGILNIYFL